MRISIITFALALACVSMVSVATSSAGSVQTQDQPVQQDQDQLVGQRFIDVQAKDVNGKTHRLSQYAGKGKWILLAFLARLIHWSNGVIEACDLSGDELSEFLSAAL